jgi:hypothetical protein
LLSFFSSLLFSSVAFAVDITACGTTVPSRQVGVLQADLVCAAGSGAGPRDAAVLLLGRAALEMNGHSISAPDSVAVSGGNDGHRSRFSIVGPGSITGSGYGVWVESNDPTVVQDLTVTGSRFDAVFAGGNVSATRVVASGSTEGSGIWTLGRVRGVDVTASGNAHAGVFAGKSVSICNLTASGNGAAGVGIDMGGITATLLGSQLSGNGTAAPSRSTS